jgi:hypothetical protein
VVPALVVGAAVRIVSAFADRVPTADALIYLTAGDELLSGNGYTRFGTTETGLAPPVPLMLAGLRRLTGDDTVAFGTHHVLWGVALVAVVAALARQVAGDRAGWRAAWAAALCPGLAIALGIDGGGSELPAIVALLLAAVLVVDRRSLPTGWRAVGVGACCGLAYLFRVDSLLPSAVLLLAMGLRVHRARPLGAERSTPTSRPLLAIGSAVAVLVVLGAPWVAFLRAETGELRLTAKAQETSIESWEALARHDRTARDAIAYRLDDGGRLGLQDEVGLPELVREHPGTFLRVQQTNLGTLADEVLVPEADFESTLEWLPPTWELVPLPVLALAAWAAWRRWRETRVRLLLGLVAANVAVALLFFVQDRYLGLSVASTCVLVGVGLADLRSTWWRRTLQGALVVLCLVAGTAELSGFGGLFVRNEPTEQRAAGELLATEAGPDDVVMTRSIVVRAYFGRATIAMPYAEPEDVLEYARDEGVDLIVADDRQVGRQRPLLSSWLEPGPWPGLELRWELRVEGRRVRIFAVLPEPPPTEHPPPPTSQL